MLKYHKFLISFGLFWFLFQLPFSFGVYLKHQDNLNQSINHIQTRLALDLPRLSLPDKSLNNVGNEASVKKYIENFNFQLTKMEFSSQINSIQNISVKNNITDTYIERTLLTLGGSISIKIAIKTLPLSNYFSVMPIILAILFLYLSLDHIIIWQNRNRQLPLLLDEPQPILIINLKEKVISNSKTQSAIPLANKPLCFYVALTEFCTTNKEVILNQNKDLPIELTDLANKYFLRLIELGHTVRKRPNFSNSLEKTLSEIRAALDEAFTDMPEIKKIYYPPKAHGEGSRSKLHHYGLNLIESKHIDIIGK
ncbi:hypothetical protein CJF42_01400 [Pseudoalteromonas sp. NBT06-2]|uniref:hypothetical protein n=1 Tax=Pseudoalteromonas sp. NBT06-2 TaxID=2025950 RepID=UPI000BA78F5C|nr:hypothetical protein [Pseudoalteromonas sp. NBT06-2]PAJ76162.1 hypothetical protein CJF42_01400 [Pseudoalteromonas sp. NBT06-2]